jgi:hypothetical protein
MPNIQHSLKIWFIIHFIVDMLFGIPLLLVPNWFLTLFHLPVTELLFPRLVGAALIGIGVNSLLMHRAGVTAYQSMLNLKIVWASAAILAIVLTLLTKTLLILWVILITFIIFLTVWIYYRVKMR